MKIKVVGYKNVDYVSKKSGKRVVGCNYYFTTELTAVNSSGLQTGEFYLSADKISALECDVTLGAEYNVFFNQYQQIEMLIPCNK